MFYRSPGAAPKECAHRSVFSHGAALTAVLTFLLGLSDVRGPVAAQGATRESFASIGRLASDYLVFGCAPG